MSEVFQLIRPGYELVKVKFEWNVQVPFLKSSGEVDAEIASPFFSSQETPNSKWRLRLYDARPKISVCVRHFNSRNVSKNIDSALVKFSILNKEKQKVFQQTLSSKPNLELVEFILIREDIIQSQCQQPDGSYTFSFKVLSHVKKEPVVSPVVPVDSPLGEINCSNGLLTQLEGLLSGMKFSDVSFIISGREFPAHKSILAARSEVFDAMFQHPTKEKLTNQIIIEDIEPEVFQELLRFIYTGRVPLDKLKTTAAGLLIAADKYLLDELKNGCEKYLLRQMSPENCVELILHCDLLNPAEHLKKLMKEAAAVFRRLPSEVMATAKWEKMEEENPRLLFKVQKILFRNN